MSQAVYCLARNEGQAIRIANRLRDFGIPPADISMLYPNPASSHDLAHENATKAPEGAMAGAGTGLAIGGALGWMAGIGALAIPGLGPLIAAGPIMAALSGAAVGGAMGGLAGSLIGLGIPEYEAKQYEGKLREGNILISVHAVNRDQVSRVKSIMSQEEADAISTGGEARVPS